MKIKMLVGMAGMAALLGVTVGSISANAQDVQNQPKASAALPTADRPVLQHRFARYRIERSDVVDLDFPLVPEYDQEVTVQPDGYVTLKDVGDLHVEGMTTSEFTEAVRKAYADARILHDPVVTINLKDFQKPYFTALGQLGKPGKYELREDITVAEAVAIAGGFTAKSKHSQVLLLRRVSGDLVEVKNLNMKKMLAKGDLSEDVFLQPGDMLYVPQNVISKIQPFIPYYSISAFPQQF
jgi:polysaccharide export outer membrane protein